MSDLREALTVADFDHASEVDMGRAKLLAGIVRAFTTSTRPVAGISQEIWMGGSIFATTKASTGLRGSNHER